MTLQAWDKGSPQKSAVTSVTLDIMTYATLDSAEETIKLEIDEGMPAGNSTSCLPCLCDAHSVSPWSQSDDVGTPVYHIEPPPSSIDATYRIDKDPLGAFRVHSTSGVLFLKNSIDAEKTYQTSIQVCP